MSDPKDIQEYNERFAKAHRIEGFGITGVTVHMPCPACCAPDFIIHKVIEIEEAFGKGATCKQCNRAFKAIFTHEGPSTSFEVVQTSGPDMPSFIPAMRRVP